MNAIDTNDLVYSFDENEPVRKAKAVELIDWLILRPDETLLLWQVVGELLACLRRWERAGRLSPEDLVANFTNMIEAFPVQSPNKRVVAESLSLSSRYSLSHWDSMLLGACVDVNVDVLYSEDLTFGMKYDSVTVINPFL